MARIRPLKEEEVLPENRGRFESNQAKFGTVLNSTGVYAYCPPILNGVTAMGAGIEGSGLLSRQLHCLLNIRVASMVGCAF